MIRRSDGSAAEIEENVELCEEKDGELKLNVANGNVADEVPVTALTGKVGDWPNTTVVLETAAWGLDKNREAATPENDCIADVVHGTPNILSDCSIINTLISSFFYENTYKNTIE